MQGRVPRGVLGPHVGPVEEQVLQVLHVSIPAGLKQSPCCESGPTGDTQARPQPAPMPDQGPHHINPAVPWLGARQEDAHDRPEDLGCAADRGSAKGS